MAQARGSAFWLGVALLATMLSACATPQGSWVWVQALPLQKLPDGAPNPIEPRDTLLVSVEGQPALSGEFVVRDDGCLVLGIAGNVCVGGKAPESVSKSLEAKLSSFVVTPRVSVFVSRAAPLRVSVVGEVKAPGVYELTRDRSVLGALAAAGWLTDFAQPDAVFVVRRNEPARRIRFRVRDLTTAEPASSSFRLRDGDAVVVE